MNDEQDVLPLAGTRVLDFCWIGAGALVTKTLAELGASVYRVESRSHPDNLRLSPPFRPGAEGLEGSGYFASRNPSKFSVALNMSTEHGRVLACRLASQVDVVTSNFRPGIMDRWGLSYDQLRAQNPSLLYLTMPMQGATGPHATYVGFGSTISALSGLVALSGLPGRTPVGTGTHYPDHVPNPGHALVALLAAIRHRRLTGEGQAIELAQLESTVNVIGPAVVEASAGTAPTMTGNRVDGAAPHGVYQCKDGEWVVIECRSDDQWTSLCSAFGQPQLGTDHRFADLAQRKRHEDQLDQHVAAAVIDRVRADLMRALGDAGVPSACVKSSRDIVEDPVLWQRGFWQQIEHPVIGTMPISRSPFRRVGSPRANLLRPALLGEHTWEVLSAELGMTHGEYDRLVDEQVLYSMAEPSILVQRAADVATVTLNRPERRNALDDATRELLDDVFADLENDPMVRCVVLTGAGTAFCAGTDLTGGAPASASATSRPLVAAVDAFTRPVIAAVNGPAAGGGFEFALAADLRIAAPEATFLLPELRIGSLPGSGGTQRIFAALPSAVAAKALYSGLAIDSTEALRTGLVSDIHPADQLVDAAVRLATRIAEAAPLSLRAAKRAARAALDDEAGFRLERQLWAELADTHDRREGRAAFREKRPPQFEGR